jgi:hypothetical protein
MSAIKFRSSFQNLIKEDIGSPDAKFFVIRMDGGTWSRT